MRSRAAVAAALRSVKDAHDLTVPAAWWARKRLSRRSPCAAPVSCVREGRAAKPKRKRVPVAERVHVAVTPDA
eukprot:SAG31_NODE_2153_length_6310_cov_2.332261_1_plen_73_part_00